MQQRTVHSRNWAIGDCWTGSNDKSKWNDSLIVRSMFRKVLSRFGMNVPEAVMRGICLGRNGLIEIFLYNLRTKIDEYVLHQLFVLFITILQLSLFNGHKSEWSTISVGLFVWRFCSSLIFDWLTFSINKLFFISSIFFFRVLHQKSKTNETNSLTPRQRPSPSVDHPGHGSRSIRISSFFRLSNVQFI